MSKTSVADAANSLHTFVLEGAITTQAPLATCSKDLMDREGGSNKPIPVPTTTTAKGTFLMYPATGIRGALRRKARDILRAAQIARDGNPTPLSLDQHYFLTLGGIKGEGAQDRSTVAMEAYWLARNPLLALFGAGDAGVLSMVHGHLSVGNAIASDPTAKVIFSGARTDDFYRDKSQVRFLSDEDIGNLINRAKGGKDLSGIKAQIKALDRDVKKASRAGKADEEAALRARIAVLEADAAAVKSDSGTSDNSIGRPLAGWQAIPQGLDLEQRMILVRSNDIELGFLLHILNHFAIEPLLGAHYAAGHGVVSGKWTVTEPTLAGRKELGTVAFKAFEPLSITDADATAAPLRRAWSAFEAYLASNAWDISIPTAV